MELEGRCYCGAVRYKASGDAMFRGQCYCRECQYITGGSPVLIMGMPEAGFEWSQGAPKAFKRSDIENPVTREFCAECGTHLTTRAMPGVVLIKVGTLDDPSVFKGPDMAIYTIDKQSFHQLPEGVPTFERTPG